MKRSVFIIPMLALSLTVSGLVSCGEPLVEDNQEQNDHESDNKNFTINIEPVKNITVNVDVVDKLVGDSALITLVFKADVNVLKVTVNDVEATKLSNTTYKFQIVEGENNIKIHIQDEVVDPVVETGTVTISPNAFVDITPNKASGNVGDVITLDVNITDNNYVVDYIKVNKKNATKISATEYEFRLEKGENLVTAYLSKKETEPEVPAEMLPNGYQKIAAPDNLNNPIDIAKKDFTTFDCSYEVPENWKYIYMNKSTNGDFYEAYGQHIALSFTDPGRGIQTPALVSATKYELRMTVSELHGTNSSVGNSKKDTFLIYGYDEDTKLIYQQGYTPFKKGIDKDRKDDIDITIYLENPEVRYFEVRLNDRLFNDKANPKYVNFGISTLKLRAYNY